MSANSDKLREMIDDAPQKSDDIAGSISQIEDARDEVDEELSAVQDGMCGVAETDMTDYLTNTKLVEFQVSQPTAQLSFGATYGTIAWSTPGPEGNITDWEIFYMTVELVPVKVVLYEYEGTGWDNDADIITWADDYDFGNDYLTRPLTTGATYGLIPYKTNLNSAISLLTNNQNKIDDSITYFEDYAT